MFSFDIAMRNLTQIAINPLKGYRRFSGNLQMTPNFNGSIKKKTEAWMCFFTSSKE